MKALLTERQQSILDFIEEFSRSQGMAPTISEAAQFFKIKPATAFAHLRALQRKGFIDRSSKARSLCLTRKSSPKHLSLTLSVPMLGRISAGLPLFAEQNIENNVQVDPSMLPPGIGGHRLFGLKVVGYSMIEKGIHDGDTVIAKESISPEIGKIVIALVDNEATIKTFYLDDGKVELRPANPRYESHFYNYDEIVIQGIAVALIRTIR